VKSWSFVDFVLVWLGGILGGTIFVTLGQLMSAGPWVAMIGLAGQYVGFGALVLLIARRRDTTELGLQIEVGDLRYLALGVFLQLLVATLLAPLAETLMSDGGQPQQLVERIVGPDPSTALRITFFTASVVPGPFFEELIYRGILLRSLIPRGRIIAIVGTSVIFAAVHIPDLNFENLAASMAVVITPLLALALLLAWLTLRRRRLGPAIFLHSGWNLLAAIVLLIPSEVLESVG
jgi:membrane protease YdiL (CAAX protease family)